MGARPIGRSTRQRHRHDGCPTCRAFRNHHKTHARDGRRMMARRRTLLRVTIHVTERWSIGGVADGAISWISRCSGTDGGSRTRHLRPLPHSLAHCADISGPRPRTGSEWNRAGGRYERVPSSADGGGVCASPTSSSTTKPRSRREVTRVDSVHKSAQGGSLRVEGWVSSGQFTLFAEHAGPYDAELAESARNLAA